MKATQERIALDARREPWPERYAAAVASQTLIVVRLPSHQPALFEQITGQFDSFDWVISQIQSLLDQHAWVALEHELDIRNLRALPDFVRFVDERFPALAGVRFEPTTNPDLDMVEGVRRPWWESARHSCHVREVPYTAPPDWSDDGPQAPGLRAAPKRPVKVAPAELAITGIQDGVPAAFERAVDRLGGLARFVHPARLAIPADLLARYCRDQPRDDARVHRQIGGQPRIAVNIGRVGRDGLAPARSALISEIFARISDLDGHPVLVYGPEDEAAELDVAPLMALVAPHGGDLVVHSPSARSTSSEADFVLVLPGSHRVVEATWSLLPAAVRASATDTLQALLTGNTMLGEGGWESQLAQDALAGAETVEQPPFLGGDLWIAQIADELVLATDPLALESYWTTICGAKPSRHLKAARARDEALVDLRRSVVNRDPPPPPEPDPGNRFRGPRSRPLTILGVASTTLQNHAAALIRDGEIVAAVQEERLRRRKQRGWHPPGRPGVTVVSDVSIPLEEAFPQRAIDTVLAEAGLSFDEVDCVALNGVPAKYFGTYSLTDPRRPPFTISDGRYMFIPHHLAHAASAYRVSGMDDAFVFTVDGRGERETAAFFEARDGRLHRVFDILVGADSLIGGVYEFITTILGFGHYGQGSTMGLAPLGEATIDMRAFLSAKSADDFEIHDAGIMEAFGHYARTRNGPLEQEHLDLAASVQEALEETVIALIRSGLEGRPATNLCLAGGVALNCSMNQRIRQALGVENIYVQPAAHDAGTALGAALEAHFEITGEPVLGTLDHACLGRTYRADELGAALDRFGLPYTRHEDVPKRVGDLVAEGAIVCWFEGRSEFGPRALGARSILADPRSAAIRDRLNILKGRQWWRPFGPSILAGHESTYFEASCHSPFMLFTFAVRPERQAEIPAVVHVDGTTRPQSVTADARPHYHAMISQFYARTGVPMVVNTSFNTAFEPIVESPEDAIASFLSLGADYLAIGDAIVSRVAIEATR